MSAKKTKADFNMPVLLKAAYPDLTTSAIQTLIDTGCVANIPAGQKLFSRSDQCCGVMWLAEGSVRVHRHAADGREVTLYRVTPGDLCILSLYQLFHIEARAAEAHAETHLLGIVVPTQKMLQLLDNNQVISYQLLKYLTGRLHEIGVLVSETAFNRLELRLACLLGKLMERSGGTVLNTTHETLAHELGTTREVMSRLLKQLEHRGCLRLSRGHIEIVSPNDLEHIQHDF